RAPDAINANLANDVFNHVVRERSEVFGTLALFKALAGLSDQRNADTEGPGGKGDRRLDRKLAPEPARGIGGSLLGSVIDLGLSDGLGGHDGRGGALPVGRRHASR